MPSDWSQVNCGEDYELEQILEHFKRSKTNENIEDLRKKCKEFKNDSSYAPHNRDSFYKYLKTKFGW